MRTLIKHGRIDFHCSNEESDPRLTLDILYGEARGQMFGILECTDGNGRTVNLKAFSCQYNGVWLVDGWVPPLFDIEEYNLISDKADREIKALGAAINSLPPGPEQQKLIHKRKKISQNAMKAIHALYRVHNFRGQVSPLSVFFPNGIPTGAGDCCAPKLLNEAAKQNLTPVGLAEFYWGRTNRSGTRVEGVFYPACTAKCQPIMGFMLCGLK